MSDSNAAVAPDASNLPVAADADDNLILEGVDLEDAAAASNDSDDGDSDANAQDALALGEEPDGEYPTMADNANRAAPETDWNTLSKSDAKKLLSKGEYKQWKKLHKKKDSSAKEKKKHDKEKKKKEKHRTKEATADNAGGAGDSTQALKSAKPTRRPRRAGAAADGGEGQEAPAKRQRRETKQPVDAYNADENAQLGGEGGAPDDTLQRAATTRPSAASQKQLRDQLSKVDAHKTLELMKQARHDDELARRAGRPPLHRVAIKDAVVHNCRRVALHEYLVHGDHGGFLNELSFWLWDRTRKELGPIDLRTSALELLLAFEIYGVTHMYEKASAKKKASMDDDITKYEGISRAELEDASIGKAVNFIRTHPQETPRNRNMACKILQRFSRAFSGELDNEEQDAEPKWGCMGDPTVLTPFNTLKTASELFHQRITKVDDLDPTSYARVPPRRIDKSVITNLRPK